jgi:uncharacterized protein YidB (DUF937 family)
MPRERVAEPSRIANRGYTGLYLNFDQPQKMYARCAREEEVMDILEFGTQLLRRKLGGAQQVDAQQERPFASALSQLLGDGQGGVNLSALVTRMTQNADLGSLVNSWLGDGDNKPIEPERVKGVFGEGPLANFARTLGVDTDTAASDLADVLPQMVDKSSRGGQLLEGDSLLGNLMEAARSLLR